MIYFLMAAVFIVGYIAIALEHNLHVDKAASALLTAIIIWTLLVFGADTLLVARTGNTSDAHAITELLNSELRHHLAEIAEILFFLMGAMVIVELIDAHHGFDTITNRIQTSHATTLLWIIGILTFFLSALLDNLTTTIVMISLLRKLVADKELRWWFAGIIVVCANAGGAWSPIGDVTTTMLWIGNQITAHQIITSLILPSLIAAILPIIALTFIIKGRQIQRPEGSNASPLAVKNNPLDDFLDNPLDKPQQSGDMLTLLVQIGLSNGPSSLASSDTLAGSQSTSVDDDANNSRNDSHNNSCDHASHIASINSTSNSANNSTVKLPISTKMRTSILVLGLGALAFVPIFKTVTHLPPYMGMLFGVGVLWVVTEVMHRHQNWYVKQQVTVVGVLTRVDMPSILFFLGILLAVSGLATGGQLADMAHLLDTTFGNLYVINVFIGLLSSLVDNVPLVAGAMKMYPLLTDANLTGLSGVELARQSQLIQDGAFWHFLAYCAGTGGSCLIIGSAAGVAAMGMEKIPFMWYLKRISGLALLGYLAGAATYIAIHVL